MKIWQQAMIGLARNDAITEFVQRQPRFDAFAKRFVGGATTAEALIQTASLREAGIHSSLFFLGEYVTDTAVINATIDALVVTAEQLGANGHDVCISVDPTQVGLMIDPATCAANMHRLAQSVSDAPGPAANTKRALTKRALMIDMEDASVTDTTLELHRRLQADGLPVAVTIQGYLYRTLDDLEPLVEAGSWIRLVKGAFAEPKGVAERRKQAIDSNYRKAASIMLSPNALASGVYPAFGTHDDLIIDEIITLATANGWHKHQYEFEMLLGVRPELQRDLADNGHQVRLYVPFGNDWFPYAIRRVGESPRNLRFAAKAVAASLA